MKSYWIAAAAVLAIAWPGSKASAIFAQQTSADSKPVEQTQSSSSSASLKNPVETSVKVKSAPTAATTPAAQVKAKDSYMLVELSKGLNSKKLKVGDKVKAEVSQDIVSHGKVIIPVETKLVGHVTEVSARDSVHPESRLGIMFDRILLKHFHDIDFEAVVQAISQPVIRRSLVDQPSQMLPPSMAGAGPRGSVPTGRNNAPASGGSGQGGAGGGSASLSAITTQAPVTIKASAAPHADSSPGTPEITTNGKSMSVGMPQGVFGLKGLSLSPEQSPSTPGPVIVSSTENVKLDEGTQILLHVLRVELPANVKPAK